VERRPRRGLLRPDYSRNLRGVQPGAAETGTGRKGVCNAAQRRHGVLATSSRAERPLEGMVDVSARFLGSQEYGRVGVPVGFAELPADQQRRLGLSIVHQGVLEMAEVRGWDPVALTGSLHHVKARALRYRSEGP
jgi:hypothetical protein